MVFGRSESLNGSVHLNSNIFLTLYTWEFEDYFVDCHIIGSSLGFEGITNQFGGGLLVSNVELFGNVSMSFVNDENRWSYAWNDVAFSKRLSLRSLRIEFWIVSSEIGGKRILELVDRILIVLTIVVVGVRNFFSIFALLTEGTAKERKYHS